jgi:hypothetical protein
MKGLYQFLCLIGICVLASCSAKTEDTALLHKKINIEIAHKSYGDSISSSSKIVPITDDGFIMVKSWFSADELLYVRSNNSFNELIKYNILTGDTETFYSTEHAIIQVQASENFRYFAIESKDMQNNSIITIINESGEILYEDKAATDLVEFAWNPYEEESLMFTYYYSDFTTEIGILNILTGNVIDVDVTPYVQWFYKDYIAFLNWDDQSTLSAPLELYHIQTKEIKPFRSNALVFDSVKNHFLVVETTDEQLTFEFFNSQNQERMSTLKMPQLNSHSGFYWTPLFDWNEKTKKFYTFQPESAGSLLDYNEGFYLIEFQLETMETRKLMEVDFISSVKVSPNGEYLLIGDLLENIIEVDTGNMNPLLK